MSSHAEALAASPTLAPWAFFLSIELMRVPRMGSRSFNLFFHDAKNTSAKRRAAPQSSAGDHLNTPRTRAM